MGQQQLLLLVLGIVIVGLAVVAGINAFSENQQKSERDAIVNEGMRIATDIESWRLKPGQLGGGGGDYPTASQFSSVIEGGTPYQTPWGNITYDEVSGNDGVASLTLQPNSGSGATDYPIICLSANENPSLEAPQTTCS